MLRIAASFRFLALAGLLALAGCARLRASGAPDDISDLVTVSVVNHYKLNVVVYNVVHGNRTRLGEVTASSSETFELHLRHLISNDIQLYADPIGARVGFTSEVVHLSAGDTLEWTLETDLARSHIEIR